MLMKYLRQILHITFSAVILNLFRKVMSLTGIWIANGNLRYKYKIIFWYFCPFFLFTNFRSRKCQKSAIFKCPILILLNFVITKLGNLLLNYMLVFKTCENISCLVLFLLVVEFFLNSLTDFIFLFFLLINE